MIGKTISHYKILEKLGEGGMGEVYKAQDLKLDRFVALKFLPHHLLANEEDKVRFRHEAKAASTLNHANIMTIFDIHEEEGETFIAMECIEGESLKDKLEKGPLRTKELLKIAIQVSEGLQAAHEAEIVHRDIKTENIMISKDGQIKILDFGLAKRKGMSKLTKTGSTLGTLAYMSPEQVEGLEVDRRSDLYSLGVVLYEMATGRKPFEGEHDAAVMYSIVNEEPLPVLTLNPNVPQELDRIIHKALEKEPENRYQHADDLSADLKRLKKDSDSGRTSITKTYTTVPTPPATKPTSRAPWYTLGVVLVVVIAGAFYLILKPDTSEVPVPVIQVPEINPKSVAVLPFAAIGESKEDEYFSEGIHDDILTQLAKIGDLKVISRTSVNQYKGTQKTMREIAAELNVANILEGSVRRAGDRIRIVAQLAKADTDEHLWAETYDRDYTDIFAIQSDVAQQIAAALKATLTPEEKRLIEKQPTDNMEAYDYYLRGNNYLNRGFQESDIRIAIDMYEEAIDLDSNFALAYTNLSLSHSSMYFFYYDRTDERLGRAKQAVEKALYLKPGLPEAYLALGYYYYWGFLDYERALEQFDIAKKSQPNNADLWGGIGYVRRRQGEFEKALMNLRKAAELDPRSAQIALNLAETFYLMRDYPAAERYFDRSISMMPDLFAYTQKAWVYILWQGSTARARDVLEVASEKVDKEQLVSTWILTDVFAGDYEAALERLASVELKTFEDQFEFTPKSLLYGQIYSFNNQSELARIHYDSARVILENKLQGKPGDARLHSSLGIAYAGLGRRDEAIREGKLAVELLPVSKEAWRGVIRLQDMAQIYAMVGEHQEAIDLLEYLLSIPGPISNATLRANPVWDPLRDNPRFQKLIAEG